MSDIDDNVVPVLYALLALEQEITISELAVGAQNRSMPEADTETPQWFAAATESVDLLVMAPELREAPEDSSESEGLDIIGVYAPEMAKVRETRLAQTTPEAGPVTEVGERIEDAERVEVVEESVPAAAAMATPGPLPPEAPKPASKDRKPSQFDLLKELGDLSE